jgi:hypothetical protein
MEDIYGQRRRLGKCVLGCGLYRNGLLISYSIGLRLCDRCEVVIVNSIRDTSPWTVHIVVGVSFFISFSMVMSAIYPTWFGTETRRE